MPRSPGASCPPISASQASGRQAEPRTPKPNSTDPGGSDNAHAQRIVSVAHTDPVTIHTRDARELANFFQQKDPVAQVYLKGNLHVGRDTPLVFQGQKLTIEPEPGLEGRPEIRDR